MVDSGTVERKHKNVETYGPEHRALFESKATDLYEEVVAKGELSASDDRIADGGPLHGAFALLRDLGLLTKDPGTDFYTPVDPSSVQSRVVSPLGQEGAKLLEESSQWAKAFSSLTHAWRRAPQSAERGPFAHIHDEAIAPFIAGLVADAEEELLTAQPQTGRNPQALARAALSDTAALERGVKMRTLYQHSARRSAITHKYVTAVTARGAEVRTLDEFFNRMIVIDRRVAIIPGPDNLRTAIAVREPGIVAYLVDIFQRTWERGRPFADHESSMMKGIAAEQRAMTIRMLIEGHADPVSAKRLGVSPRTYAGYVADLKAEYEAETRFQLGYTMGSKGVSGNEHDPAVGAGDGS